jgi:hypothetical protein
LTLKQKETVKQHFHLSPEYKKRKKTPPINLHLRRVEKAKIECGEEVVELKTSEVNEKKRGKKKSVFPRLAQI